ncbi:probable E3 ubiquitin-protein ligase XBOS36 isoform X3 [Phragmites australis]|uniref:probable E3 ubiquitin-protein ligase XBOS36 isoform X3 n=1 Tax=Phragmites australis TaxID=29695 RepID=UPI002D78142E|nr:probable E3 ubiquitin-protein ligase XBOS36 isoform X3 [Phragmites australis]
MGNALGCVGLGERLAAAATDGDAAEARRLLAANPGLARCAALGSLNSPLHLAAAKGHHEIAALLLENGADVNARNIYGQTALMQACRFGHWEVAQTLLVFRCNVSKVDSLSSRTALHLAAAGGHVKCVRLLLAAVAGDGDRLCSYVNKAASGGVTALHLAALHGHVDCVHLLIDEHADLAAQTLPCVASPMGSIGAGSNPLHYAAAGGEVKCCQILVSRGADRTAVNYNGQVAPGGRGEDVGLPLAAARAVAQVTPADTQVPAVRLPLLAARRRAQPREGVRPGSELAVGIFRRRRRLRGVPGKTLQRGCRSVRARAVREMRAGSLLGDQILRRAWDRRIHPVPTLPERDRLVQEASSFRSTGRT